MRTDVKLGVVLGLAVLGMLAWWVTRDDGNAGIRIVDANASTDEVETADAGATPMPPPLFAPPERDKPDNKSTAKRLTASKASSEKRASRRSVRPTTDRARRGATSKPGRLAHAGANEKMSLDSVRPPGRRPQLIAPPGTKVTDDKPKPKKKPGLPTLDPPKSKADASKKTRDASTAAPSARAKRDKSEKTVLPKLPPIGNAKASTTKPATVRPKKKPKPPEQKDRVHVVEKYDSFAVISEKYYGSQRLAMALFKANPTIKDPRRLKPGMKLRIPPKDVLLNPSKDRGRDKTSTKPAAKESADKKAPPETATANKKPAEKKPAKKKTAGAKVYVVQKDDSYYAIARELLGDGTRWKEIHTLNKDVCPSPQDLKPGMKLRVPPK